MRAVLTLEGISKAYPGVQALSDVDLAMLPGEVVGLVGENGAGKSTVIKIITGVVQPDTGSVLVNGAKVLHQTPASALQAGISAIYQEFTLIPELTVAENIFYGRELRRGPFLDRAAMIAEAQRVLTSIGAEIDSKARLRDLNIGQQQLVEIAKAMSRRAKLLIMDEPTAPLTNREVECLYAVVRRLKADGIAVLYISHRLEEIFDLCDRVTVLRDGRQVKTLATHETTRDELVTLMVGRALRDEFPPSHGHAGRVLLEVRNLRSLKVQDVSFTVRAGEILGLAGLVGAGRTEAARLIFAADPLQSGEIRINGRAVTIRSPTEAIANGIGLIPEDRKHHGVLLGQTIHFNIIYGALRAFSRWGFVKRASERQRAEQLREQLRIRTPSIDEAVRNLSGGNQQKVVLAKWLLVRSEILIFDEPTRGIDIGAKQEIYRLMRDLAAGGKAIVMISSEMPELLGMSDRLIVLYRGRVAAELDRAQFDQEAILRYASGFNGSKVNQPGVSIQ